MLISFLLVLRLASICAAAAAASAVQETHGGWRMGLRPRQEGQNIQPFDGALGGIQAPAISNSGNPERPFEVEDDTFPDFQSAANRACDRQKNTCAEAANNGGGNWEVSDCDQQNAECKEVAASATETAFRALVSSDGEFDYFCDI